MKTLLAVLAWGGLVCFAGQGWAADPVVFEDSFAGPMKEGWSWVREDSTDLVIRQATGSKGESGLIGDSPVPPETESERDRRRALVAERRSRLPILVHRGATDFAPENSIAAMAAALDKGAEGVEFDIRRSRDGVLYLFHDDTLDRMTDRKGPVKGLDYAELSRCRLAGGGETVVIPRLEELFGLARRRAALLHLDVKEPGLEEELVMLLNKYDLWDHVVRVNDYNAGSIRGDERCRMLQYKGWLPQSTPADWGAIETFMEQPGTMIFCKEDPTLAVEARKRFKR